MRGWATGRGQKKNGEMIKYCAVKFSRPNSDRLPIQYPPRTGKHLLVRLCSSLRAPAWQHRSVEPRIRIYPPARKNRPGLGPLLSQCPAFLVPLPVFVRPYVIPNAGSASDWPAGLKKTPHSRFPTSPASYVPRSPSDTSDNRPVLCIPRYT